MEQVTLFKCGKTGRLFDSAEKAKNSERRYLAKKRKEAAEKENKLKRDMELEYQRNYVRLNAKYPNEIFPLVREKALEFWGIELDSSIESIKISTRKVENDRYNTENKYVRLPSFSLSANIVDKEKFKNMPDFNWFSKDSISNLFSERGGFRGFSTESGNPGEYGSYPFRMDMKILISDFPLIMENYKKYRIQRQLFEVYQNNKGNQLTMARRVALNTPEIKNLQEKRTAMLKILGSIDRLQKRIEEHHMSEFTKLFEARNPPQFDTSLFSKFE